MRRLKLLFSIVIAGEFLTAAFAVDGIFKENLQVVVRGVALTPSGQPFWSFNSRQESEVAGIRLPNGSKVEIVVDSVQTDISKEVKFFIAWNGKIEMSASGQPALFEGWKEVRPVLGPNSLVVHGIYRNANRKSVPAFTMLISVGHKVGKSDQNLAEWLGIDCVGYDGPLEAKPMAAFCQLNNCAGSPLVDLTPPAPAQIFEKCEKQTNMAEIVRPTVDAAALCQLVELVKSLRETTGDDIRRLANQIIATQTAIRDNEIENDKQFREVQDCFDVLAKSLNLQKSFLAELDESLKGINSNLETIKSSVDNNSANLERHELENVDQMLAIASWLKDITDSLNFHNDFLSKLGKSIETINDNVENINCRTNLIGDDLSKHQREVADEVDRIWKAISFLPEFSKDVRCSIQKLNANISVLRADLNLAMDEVNDHEARISNLEAQVASQNSFLSKAFPPHPFRVQWLTASGQLWGGKIYLYCSDKKKYTVPYGFAEWNNNFDGQKIWFYWRFSPKDSWSLVQTTVCAGETYKISPNGERSDEK